MNIKLIWHEPILLGHFKDIESVVNSFDYDLPPKSHGIYIFYREYGDKQYALYVGQATDLNKRLCQQFKNFELLNGLRNSKKGSKWLIYAELSTKSQRTQVALNQAERALIRHFIEDKECDLINKHTYANKYDFIIQVSDNPIGLIEDDLAISIVK